MPVILWFANIHYFDTGLVHKIIHDDIQMYDNEKGTLQYAMATVNIFLWSMHYTAVTSLMYTIDLT